MRMCVNEMSTVDDSLSGISSPVTEGPKEGQME